MKIQTLFFNELIMWIKFIKDVEEGMNSTSYKSMYQCWECQTWECQTWWEFWLVNDLVVRLSFQIYLEIILNQKK